MHHSEVRGILADEPQTGTVTGHVQELDRLQGEIWSVLSELSEKLGIPVTEGVSPTLVKSGVIETLGGVIEGYRDVLDRVIQINGLV